MKTRNSILPFLLIIMLAVPMACNFNPAASLFATPTPTATNTPPPTTTPTATPTSTPVPPGETYRNSNLDFEMTFPAKAEITDLDFGGLSNLSGFPESFDQEAIAFLIGSAGDIRIGGFFSESSLADRLLEEVINIIAYEALTQDQKVIEADVFTNPQEVQIGTIKIDLGDGSYYTNVYFFSKETLVYFTFLYDSADETGADAMIAGIIDSINLK